MGLPIVRQGDISTPDPCGAGSRPAIGGSPNVSVNGRPVIRVGDAWAAHACPKSAPHTGVQAAGSSVMTANGLRVARVGDAISCGSTAATGSPNASTI